MSLIDDIRRDREAGTPGPWRIMRDQDGHYKGEIAGPAGTDHSGALADWVPEYDACRIARVPDMEAALLAAEELAEALVVQHEAFGLTPECVKALAAYRAAVEAKA